MLYDKANKNLQQFGFYHCPYFIDEQMIPYTGKTAVSKPSEQKAYDLIIKISF